MKKILILILYLFLIFPVYAHEESEHHVLSATVIKNRISGDVAVYNLSNGKLHTSDCEWAEKCTKNCIYLSKKELKKKFYIPCLVCGGGVIEPISDEESE
ncbi:MAG: hypothetical protein K6A44_01380 [bacterium]|nr:hypothetical protein [bacterium]